jgi:nucleoside-diphosphate-sugar epimerase
LMAKNDDVVVIGGTGFIGRHLINELIGRVRSITIVSRTAEDGYVDSSGNLYRRGDIQIPGTAKDILKGASVVYDLSFPLGTSWDGFETRCIDSVKNLVDGALHNNLRRVFYTSTSDALYLGAKKTVTETDGTDAKPHLRNAYSMGKAAAEKILFDLYRSHKLPAIVFRPFLVVGRGKEVTHGGIGDWKAPNCLCGWGKGDNSQPFVLVQDVANAMALSLDIPDIEGQAFNLAGDVFISVREYVRLLAESSKRNFRYYPQNLIRLWIWKQLTSKIKQIAGRKIDGRSYYRNMLSSSKRSVINCSKAKQILGWKPNDNLDYFKAEAIESYFNIQPGDLRLETKTKGRG